MQKSKRSQILASLLTGSMIFGGLLIVPQTVYAYTMISGGAGGNGGGGGIYAKVGEDGEAARVNGNEQESSYNIGKGEEPNGMNGGAGGKGGDLDYEMDTSSINSNEYVFIYGGFGGDGGGAGTYQNGLGGRGGDGGNINVTTDGNSLWCDVFEMRGGNGGKDFYSSGNGNKVGEGGTGGSASFTTYGSIRAEQSFSVTSGRFDIPGIVSDRGKGGDAYFHGNRVTTPNISLNRYGDSKLNFYTYMLNIDTGGTSLSLDNTIAANEEGEDGVYIDTAMLGDDDLTVYSNNNGKARIDNLYLMGKGNFNDINNAINLGRLSVSGGTINDTNWNGIIEHKYDDDNIYMGRSGITFDVNQDKTLNRNIVEEPSSIVVDNSYNFTKTGSGTLDLNSTADYSGMTIVREGKLNVGSNRLANSAGLALYGGATFDRGTADVNWDGKQLLVDSSNNQTANYIGDLSAQNSDLYFISSTAPQEPLLFVAGDVNINSSKYNVGLSGGTQIAEGTKLTLIKTDGTLTADNIEKGTGFAGIVNIGSTIEADITNAVKVSEDGENLVIGGQEPTDPENPPVDPDPEQPTDPENPPVDPDPEQPTDPENPSVDPDPEQPTDPENPPVDPEQPIDPDNPSVDPNPEKPGSGGSIVVDVSGSRAKAESKMLSEGFLGGVAFNLQGADLIADRGIASAIDATKDENSAIFAQISRGSIDYETGSSVDVDGTNMLLGAAWKHGKETTMGVFAEYGDGSYDTENNFNGINMKGSGDTSYFGGGFLARRDYIGTAAGHYYLEGSMRLGRTDNEYTNSYLRDSLGRTAHYDIDGMYYGMHVGAGYLRQIDEHRTLDMYGKLLWTRQEGDTTTLSTGERLNFSDINSWRWRMGARFNYNDGEKTGYYAGLAWEHEFDGEADATVNGFAIDKPSLKGDSGIAEIGMNYKPSADNPWILNLNVQTYFGARDGWRGGVEATYTF